MEEGITQEKGKGEKKCFFQSQKGDIFLYFLQKANIRDLSIRIGMAQVSHKHYEVN